MSKSPIIILGGNAGSGKDTVGAYLVEKYHAVTVAQADPMKRFAAEIFGFSEDQLWGASAFRNALDPRTVTDALAIGQRFERYVLRVLDRELFSCVIPKTINVVAASNAMTHWFDRIFQDLLKGIPTSPRAMLQTFGTEWGRLISRNMWSDYAVDTCLKLLAGGFHYSRTEGLIKDDAQVGYDFGVITDGRFRNEIVLTTTRGGVALRINRDTRDKAAVEAGGIKGHSSERELDGIPSHFWTAIIENQWTLEDLYKMVDHFMGGCYSAPQINQAWIRR